MTQATKTCTGCGESHPPDMFGIKDKATGRRHSQCRICKRAYAKQHYGENKEVYVAKAAHHNGLYRDRNRQIAADFLSKCSCLACNTKDDLVPYSGGADSGLQPVWAAIQGALSVQSVMESLEAALIFCSSCFGAKSFENLESWSRLSHPARLQLQADRKANGHVQRPASYYRNYVRRSEAPAARLERVIALAPATPAIDLSQ